MPSELTIDTTVLVHANVTLTPERAAATKQAARLDLLRRVHAHQATVLISAQLSLEYARQITNYHNDFVRAFLELVTVTDGSHVIVNYRSPWRRAHRARLRDCHFPVHDEHVLRTAVRDNPTTIYSEDGRMLRAHPCIRRHFGVAITTP